MTTETPRIDAATFVRLVAQVGGMSEQEAVHATRATLETLGERLSAGESRDIADELPEPLDDWVRNDHKAEAFHVDEFVRRVARREGHDDEVAAARDAAAVFMALAQAISADELADMESELPKDFAPLLQGAVPRVHRVHSAGEFVAAVAERTGLDVESAALATAAVLETLGERITRGEVKDLEEELPPELHPALERGDALSNGAARPMDLREFVLRVAEREAAVPQQAVVDARAVFMTLREAVSEKEFNDVQAQLPDEYAPLLARA
jgi:uncharacterized protein (DUF2267 family)